ncbi:MAG: hydrogenase expression/formation protein HypE [Phycisphaeraceae bacterium]
MNRSDDIITGTATLPTENRIVLAHGGGGQLSDELISKALLPRLGNEVLDELLDSAVIHQAGVHLAFTLDGYVVQPLRFAGGDIGRLAVSGTVNDLAVTGAEPVGLALGLILAEGLEQRVLAGVLDSIAATAEEAGVKVMTGDTKVVGRDQADGMYITTAGVGLMPTTRRLHPDRVQPGDILLINGPIGEHGLAVMLAREMPEVNSVLRSDAAPLNKMIHTLLECVPNVLFMRDPTRGGLSAVAADLAQRSGWHVVLDEQQVPIRPEASHAAEMLGLDPLEIANEGKVVVVVRPDDCEAALAALQSDERGRDAAVIGRVEDIADGICELHTIIGGRRILQKPYGEQLPRIC